MNKPSRYAWWLACYALAFACGWVMRQMRNETLSTNSVGRTSSQLTPDGGVSVACAPHDVSGTARQAPSPSSTNQEPVADVLSSSAAQSLGWGAVNATRASDEYHPTVERFHDLGESCRAALDTTPEELGAIPDEFWERNGGWEGLRTSWGSGPLLEALGGFSVDLELERLWAQPDTQALWALHQEQFLAQSNLLILMEKVGNPTTRGLLEADLRDVRGKLAQLRDALFSGSPLQFLWRLNEAMR